MTYFSKNHVEYGNQIESAEILPEGIPAAEKLAEYLKNIPTDANYSSPYKRCVETVEIIKQISGKEFVFDERLKDYDPKKNKIEEMISKIKNFTDFLKNNDFKNVAICTHGYPINAIINLTVKGKVDQSDLENYPDTGILVIIKDKQPRVRNPRFSRKSSKSLFTPPINNRSLNKKVEYLNFN